MVRGLLPCSEFEEPRRAASLTLREILSCREASLVAGTSTIRIVRCLATESRVCAAQPRVSGVEGGKSAHSAHGTRSLAPLTLRATGGYSERCPLGPCAGLSARRQRLMLSAVALWVFAEQSNLQSLLI